MSAPRNVLLIVVDQWRGLMLPKLGADYLKLPNIDLLCAEGVTFRNHFTQAVPCGPARASLPTGQYLMNHPAVQNPVPLSRRGIATVCVSRMSHAHPRLHSLSLHDALPIAERDNALLEAELADVEREAVGAEREAWKAKAADLIAANKAYDVAFDQLQAAAAEKQRLADAAAQQAAAAVAAAQRDEAKAERELGEYRRLFGKKPKDCEAALQALDRVCPTLGGY